MRLGLVIYGSLDTVSGGFLYDRRLVETLRKQGDTVEVISLPWRDYPRHLGDNLSTSLARRLAGLEIDLLLQDELNHPSLAWTNRRVKRKYPILSIVHHLRSSEQRSAWLNRFYRHIERSYLDSVDGFVFNSQTTRRAVENLVKPRPALVAYPAGDQLQPQISSEEIAERACLPGPLRLIFLGNVIPRKGLHLLLEGLSTLPPGSWSLDVAGSLQVDPPYARRMRRQAAVLEDSGKVTFHGALDPERLAALLSASHVLAVPSSYEGYGIAYLEGMGFGLPAIATRLGAAGEIITHGVDGFLIAPGEAQALSQHIQALNADRPQLLQLSQAARRRYEAQPTWEQTTLSILNFLVGFLEKWHARTG